MLSTDETLSDLPSLDKTEYSFFLLEQTNTGTIADAMAADDHNGISSSLEELAVRAPIAGKQEPTDIQPNGKNGLQIIFPGRQFFVHLHYDGVMISCLKVRADLIPIQTQ